MSLYVVDASVAAKWFLPPSGEPLADEALQLLASYAQGRGRFAVADLFGRLITVVEEPIELSKGPAASTTPPSARSWSRRGRRPPLD